jgi:1-acyl-sn-glycerol-3-phosphate acyltransferase
MRVWTLEPAHDLDLSQSQRWRSLRRESGLISTALHLVFGQTARAYFAIWHRLRVTGLENVPSKPPFILAANHSSHLDALALVAPLPFRLRDRLFPIAAGDVFFDSAWKSALSAECLNGLPMWRKHCQSHALRELRERLIHEPCAYVIFPEGTRSRNGTMQSFRHGIGALTAAADVPVVPCWLSGCHAALPPGHWLPRPVPVEVRYGKPLSFPNVVNDRRGWETISLALSAAIARLRLDAESDSVRASRRSNAAG